MKSAVLFADKTRSGLRCVASVLYTQLTFEFRLSDSVNCEWVGCSCDWCSALPEFDGLYKRLPHVVVCGIFAHGKSRVDAICLTKLPTVSRCNYFLRSRRSVNRMCERETPSPRYPAPSF